MGPIVLTGFTGCNIAKPPRLLAESVGVSALDCNPLLPGDLEPLRAPLAVASATAGSKTIYRMGRGSMDEAHYWLQWPGGVSMARGFDANDTSERTYMTGNGAPAWFDNVMALASAPYPTTTRRLAVPAPTIPPTLTQTAAGEGDEGDVFYVYTWVNDIGWESAPSPVNSINIKPGAHVQIDMPDTPPSGSYGINRTRIYRTAVGSTGTGTIEFLREVPLSTTSTTDDARALGDALPSVGWLPLPDDAFALTALWGSMFAAIAGKAILFSVPGVLYAYPEKYAIYVQDTPVALGKFEQNVVVLTTGRPIIIQGSTPDGMNDSPLPVNHACVAAASVVSFAHGVVWASNEGLGYVGSNGQSPEPLTFGIIKPEQWKALNPASMVGTRWGRMYVVSYDDGQGRKALMIDPLNPAAGVTFLSTGYDACFYDELLEALYVLDGASVKRFDGGAALTASFKSKIFRQTGPRNFPAAEVTADAYPVTFRMWADGTLRHSRQVQNGNPFSLPGGFMAEDWQVEVATSAAVQAVRLGSIDQLRGEGD